MKALEEALGPEAAQLIALKDQAAVDAVINAATEANANIVAGGALTADDLQAYAAQRAAFEASWNPSSAATSGMAEETAAVAATAAEEMGASEALAARTGLTDTVSFMGGAGFQNYGEQAWQWAQSMTGLDGEPFLGAAGQTILRDSAIITGVMAEADAAQAYVDTRNSGQSVLDSDWIALQAGGQSLWNTAAGIADGLYTAGSTVAYYINTPNAALNGISDLANYGYNNAGNAENWLQNNANWTSVGNGLYSVGNWAYNGASSFINNNAQLITDNADAITNALDGYNSLTTPNGALFNTAQQLNAAVAPVGDSNGVWWVDTGGAAALGNVPAYALAGATPMTPFTPFTAGADAFSNLTTPSSYVQTEGGSSFDTLLTATTGIQAQPQSGLAEYPSISYYTPATAGQDLPLGYIGVDSLNYGPPQPLYEPQAYASASNGDYGQNAGAFTLYSADTAVNLFVAGAELTDSYFNALNDAVAANSYGAGALSALPGAPGQTQPEGESLDSFAMSGAKIYVMGTYPISTSGSSDPLEPGYTPSDGGVSDGGSLGDGSLGGGDGGLGDGAGDGGPVELDLSGNGIKIDPLSSSNMFFDMANDGYQQHTAWAAAGDGVLVYDPGGGAVTQADQIDFKLWDPSATSDMQALEQVFDSDHDGALNASDASWSDFYVLVTNADGTTTLETMAQAGVTSIDLTPNSYKQAFTDGSSIQGETTFTRSNGTVGTAAEVTGTANVVPLVPKPRRGIAAGLARAA